MLFRERLTVPISWWLLAGLLSLSVLLAVGAFLGPVWGVGTSVAALLVAGAIFGSASIVISVDAKEIHVGRARIEHAKDLLFSTRNSLEEVAAATGFADAVHLGKTFRKMTGATPDAWRKERHR